jgi:hypothetical protein
MYFDLGLQQKDIVFCLARNHGIIISERHLRRLLKDLNLYRRKNYTSIEDTVLFINQQIQESGKLHGYRWMHERCKINGIKARQQDVRMILSALDPNSVEKRRRRRLCRRAYYSKGPNYTWHLDGYDKLKPFGFAISGCIDGYSRHLIWLNVYTTNNNPRIIAGYYYEAACQLKGCPAILRGDFGTENTYVKDFQVAFGQKYVDGTSSANQRIESFWSLLRKECMEYWIHLFHELQADGDFTGNYLDKQLLLFCFLAKIQVKCSHNMIWYF